MDVHLTTPKDDFSAEEKDSNSSFPLLSSASSGAPSPTLAITQDRRRIGWHLLASTVFLLAFSAGLAIALLIWVIYIHGVPAIDGKSVLMGAIQTGAFVVDEGTTAAQDSPQTATLRILTFSSITTQIVSLTAPLLVMMAAYCTVGVWLKQQEKPSHHGENLPTPAQFGFLVKLSSTAGIVSIYEIARYLAIGGRQKNREPAPAMFYAATISVIAIYLVTHFISAANLWLHISSTAIVRNATFPISPVAFDFSRPLPPDTYPLGVTFNDTLCTVSNNIDSSGGVPCLLETLNSTLISSVQVAGEFISANISFVDKIPAGDPSPRLPISVITLHNESDLAVIVPSPGSYDDSLTWTAPSYGLRISCRSITQSCSSSSSSSSTTSPDCTGAGYPGFPPNVIESSSFSFSNGSGTSTDIDTYYQQGGKLANPYDIQVAFNVTQWWINSTAAVTTDVLQYNGTFIAPDALAFAACQAEYFNLTLKHDIGDRYSIVDGSMEKSSDSFAGIMSGTLLCGCGTPLGLNSIIPLIQEGQDDAQMIASLNQVLSQAALGQFAGTVIPVPAFTITKLSLLSRYPVPPLLTYVSLLLVYSTLILVIFTWASSMESRVVRSRDGKEITSLKLGHRLLTDAFTLVGLALPHTLRGVEKAPLEEPIKMFGETDHDDNDLDGEQNGTGTSKLILGVLDEGPKEGLLFGVREWESNDSLLEDQHSSSRLAATLSEKRAPSLLITQERKRIGWHLLFSTLVIIALSAGLAISLLVWVVHVHGVASIDGKSVFAGAIETGTFIVNEGTTAEENSPDTATLWVLTFSSITTQIVSFTAPLLVMMAAYCIVGVWLNEQERSIQGEGLPTPAQFGFLVKLSSATGIASLYAILRYLVSSIGRKRRISTPAMFYAATISVASIYLITHLISAADLWLHISSSAILWNTSLPISSANLDFSHPLPLDSYPLGVTFNDTLCVPFETNNGPTGLPCLSNAYSSQISIWGAGAYIASNISFVDKISPDQPNPRLPISVITLHDDNDLAVIVPSPGSYDESMTWTASSYGIRITCRSITEECTSNQTSYDCTGAGYPGFPQTSFPSSLLSFSDGSNNTHTSNNFNSFYLLGGRLTNPYDIQLALNFTEPWVNATVLDNLPPYNGTFVTSGELAFAACQVEFFNLTVRHDVNDRYSAVNGTMERSSDAFATNMAVPLFSGIDSAFPGILTPLLGVGKDDDSILAALNQVSSQAGLSIFAGAVIPVHALTVTKPSLLSRYPVSPFLTYVSLLFIYSILVLAIFIWASTIKSRVVRARDGKETTSLKLGQSLLTDSLMLVGLALPKSLHGIDEDSPLKKPIEMFGEVPEEDRDRDRGKEEEENGSIRRRAPRLVLGVVDEGPKAGKMFGVREWKPVD